MNLVFSKEDTIEMDPIAAMGLIKMDDGWCVLRLAAPFERDSCRNMHMLFFFIPALAMALSVSAQDLAAFKAYGANVSEDHDMIIWADSLQFSDEQNLYRWRACMEQYLSMRTEQEIEEVNRYPGIINARQAAPLRAIESLMRGVLPNFTDVCFIAECPDWIGEWMQ